MNITPGMTQHCINTMQGMPGATSYGRTAMGNVPYSCMTTAEKMNYEDQEKKELEWCRKVTERREPNIPIPSYKEINDFNHNRY